MKLKTFKARAFDVAVAVAATLAGAAAAPAGAAGVPLDAAPPDLLRSVAPNIALTFDDSGSMARAYMPDSIGDLSTWDATATGVGSIHHSYYYFAETNRIYYDPAITYTPPLQPDGVTRFPDSSYTAAWRDGICANLPANGSLGTACTSAIVNLSTSFYIGFDSHDGRADSFLDANSRNQARYLGARNIPNVPRTSGGTVHNGGFYHARDGAGVPTLFSVNAQGAAQKKNFANWYSYYRTRSLMARSGIATAFAKRDGKVRIAWQNLNTNGFNDDTTIESFAGTKRSDFFKWLYSEKSAGGTPNRAAMVRTQQFFRSAFARGRGTGGNGRFNPYWENITGQANGGMELSCRQNFHLLVTDGYWNADSPADVTPKVSSSFALPDRRTYTSGTAHTRVYSSEDRSNGGNAAPSLADIAFQGWASDLRADLDNNVSPYLVDSTIGETNPSSRPIPEDAFDDDEIYFNPANDPATWQHLVNFTVGLGVAGQFSADTPAHVSNTQLALRRGQLRWAVPPNTGGEKRALDDTWHAAVNSRGSFLSASNPQQLVDGIDNVLRTVAANRDSATSVATVTSTFNTPGVVAYGTRYSSRGWTGDVVSREGRDGQAGGFKWSAAAQLNGRAASSRRLFTSGGASGAGVPLRYGSLNAQQQATLDKNPASGTGNRTRREDPANWTVDGLGSRRVDYLRGDRSAETAPPNFRARRSILGAIIDSQPLYVSAAGGLRDAFPVGSPEHAAFVRGDTYENFMRTQRARTPMVYIGSNDGMMHAFDARTGAEAWAFMPGTLLANGRAAQQTVASGELVPGADDLLISNDVFIKGGWRTVLVGTLRLGGRGVYAIDITDSSAQLGEADAAKKLLWEFNNKSDGGANLGYTYGSTNVVRLNNGKWAVAVASGYFPVDGLDSGDPAATANTTSLILLDLETGKVIRELKTPAGVTSYGLSRPGAYDMDENFTTDVIAAGDLAGNLWRFDVGSPNPAAWSVQHVFKSYADNADIGRQPISVMPLPMGDRKTKGAIWIFGTGKYIGEPDRSLADAKTQAFYGVRDPAAMAGATTPVSYPVTAGALVEQTLTVASDPTLRDLTANDVPKDKPGWRIDLKLKPGERNTLTATALDVSNLVVLSSLIPTGSGDPCVSGREGAVMIVNASTGGVAYEEEEKLTPMVIIPGGGKRTVGGFVTDPPPSGGAIAMARPGGGGISILLGEDGTRPQVTSPYWRRDGWREMFNLYDLDP